MDHRSCIYCIENTVNKKKYVGQTNDFHKRKTSHLSALANNRSHNRHLQVAYNKYGADSFTFSVLEECPIDRLDEREIYWIKKLNTYHDGYNLDMGGGGIRGYRYTDEQKQHISNALKGRIFSDETKRKMSENHADFSGEKNPNFGIPFRDRLSPEKYEKFRTSCSLRYRGDGNPNFGKKMSDEQKAKLSESHKRRYAIRGNPLRGRKRPEFSGDLHYKAHAVVCLNTKEYFSTIKEASERYKASASGISVCCTKRSGTVGKDENNIPLVWLYASDYKELSDEEVSHMVCQQINRSIHSTPTKRVRCLSTGEIFESMKDACEKYHIDASALSGHCNGRKCLNGCGRHPETKELLKWEYV